MKNAPASIYKLTAHQRLTAARGKLAVFCYSFNREDIKEMQCRLRRAINRHEDTDKLGKERLLDYLEALEVVLPVLHEIHRDIISPKGCLPKTDTYNNLVANKKRFSSLKRRPD